MPRIAVLDQVLANQIAAGEVVERPASVVKELVENALDAGAGQITVQVEGAGSRMIRVIDDGCGMDRDDALLCLSRHATSKLSCADDLSRLATLGFRGEAIPSIASVSRLTITTRTREADLGYRVEVRAGEVVKAHEMGCAPGTALEVADLFANLPARRKFLKSAATELAHIDEVLRALALANCQVGFRYQASGREVFDLPACPGEEGRRVGQVLGEAELIPVGDTLAAARTDIQVRGFLLPPERAAGRAGRLWILVNGRYVKDRMISHAVGEGMDGFLMRGGRPAGVIRVNLPAGEVDVNVHPTKQEVRFREGNLVHNKVVAAVWRGMEARQERLRGEVFGPARAVADPGGRDPWPAPLYAAGGELREPDPAPPAMTPVSLFAEARRPAFTVPSGAGEPAEVGDKSGNCEPEGESWRYLGQLFDAYLLCQTEDGLVAIDQHAAQERLIFEDLQARCRAGAMPGQGLLSPELIELLPAEAQVVEGQREELARLGFALQGFGGDTLLIQAVPAVLGHLPASEALRGVLASYLDDPGPGPEARRREDILAGMACKAAIKAGRRLAEPEAASLLERMRRAGIFSHCPHGRPVCKCFSRQEIERWFKRT